MALLGWLRGKLSPRHRAIWIYRRGLLRARAGKKSAAIEDYGEVINATEVDSSLRAMARYNRAVVLWSSGDEAQALDDLRQILDDRSASEQVKTEARRKLLRIDRTAEREEQAER